MTDRNQPQKPATIRDERNESSASETTETDLAQDKMGNNQLQGNDQLSARNQRQAVPDVKQDTDGVIESFEKLDKDKRAEGDLGKGNLAKPSRQQRHKPG